LPPRAVGIPRSFNSRAMPVMETMPAFRSLRIVGRRASARTSATRLIGSATRRSVLRTVLRCQLPPRALAIPLRFNSFASSRWETKPAAISFRMVGSKASAWVSAPRLLANAPCISRLLGEVSPRTGSIGRLWPRLTSRRPMLRLCRGPDLFGQQQIDRPRLIRDPQTSEGPPRKLANPDGPLTCRYIRVRLIGAQQRGEAELRLHTIIPRPSWRVTSLGARRGDGGRHWSYCRSAPGDLGAAGKSPGGPQALQATFSGFSDC
jgi:hypothetical protein